ncbi:hypothetical protein CHH28_16200 [Bacterioplanes sanyensis]|uniref:Uncharacterized protein n=1 Tax=Bacterioplanes sanyensis TaxID=1249553 RepID=A0A222FMW5_9GAMM|nr:hypothetical protein [Bacterioplanes sanyensis]ASP40120.1 hypothetical protein CHH28_16200 [Bacterioplanes sanyensis]
MNDKSRSLLDELQMLQQVLDDAAGETEGSTEFNVDDIPLLDDVFDDPDTPTVSDDSKPDSTTNAQAEPMISLAKPATASTQASNAPDSTAPTPVTAAPQASKPAFVLAAEKQAARQQSDVSNVANTPVDTPTASNKVTPLVPAKDSTASSEPLLSAADLLGLNDDNDSPDIIDMLDQLGDSDAPAEDNSNPFLPASILERLAQERAAAQADSHEANMALSQPNKRPPPPDNHDLLDDIPHLTEQQKQALLDDLVEELLPTLRYKLRQRLKDLLYS